MSIQVDVWGGDLHQNHVACERFENWEAASTYMMRRIDEGHLCNVLHTDFKAPPERAAEMAGAMKKHL